MNDLNTYKVTIVLKRKKLFRKELVKTIDLLVDAHDIGGAECEARYSINSITTYWSISNVSKVSMISKKEILESDVKTNQNVNEMIEKLSIARAGMKELIENALSNGKDYALIKEKLSAVKIKNNNAYEKYVEKYGPIENASKYYIVDGVSGLLPNDSNVYEYMEAINALKESSNTGAYRLDFINNYQFVKVNNSFYAIDVMETYENVVEDTLLVKVSIKEI